MWNSRSFMWLKRLQPRKGKSGKVFSKSDTMGFSLAYKMNFLSDKF